MNDCDHLPPATDCFGHSYEPLSANSDGNIDIGIIRLSRLFVRHHSDCSSQWAPNTDTAVLYSISSVLSCSRMRPIRKSLLRNRRQTSYRPVQLKLLIASHSLPGTYRFWKSTQYCVPDLPLSSPILYLSLCKFILAFHLRTHGRHPRLPSTGQWLTGCWLYLTTIVLLLPYCHTLPSLTPILSTTGKQNLGLRLHLGTI